MTAAARHRSPYSVDSVVQNGFPGRARNAAFCKSSKRADCPGAHPASNSVGNAFLSPD